MSLPSLLPLLLLLSLFGLLCLTSCSFLKDTILRPNMEPDVDPSSTHLAQGAGAQNQIDLGPDARSLLESFTRLKGEYFELKSKMEQVVAHNEQLRDKLQGTEKSLSAEMAKRAVAEAEAERLKMEVRKRDAEFLSLSIKKAKRDHEYYALRVAALKEQLDALNTQGYQATTPPSGRDR
jgi:predicted RNase H-like nuclease (RuvC/YqgF family)